MLKLISPLGRMKKDEPTRVSLLTERSSRQLWRIEEGGEGQAGIRINRLNGEILSGKVSLALKPGHRLRVETTGCGGCGRLPN